MGDVPEKRRADNPWPQYDFVFRTSSSHKEGGERDWAINTKSFEDDGKGNICAINVVRVEWKKEDNGAMKMVEVPGSEERWPEREEEGCQDEDADFRGGRQARRKFAAHDLSQADS